MLRFSVVAHIAPVALLALAQLQACTAATGDGKHPHPRLRDDTGLPADTDADSDADADADTDTDTDADIDSGTPAWTLAPWLSVDGNSPIDADGNVAAQMLNPALVASSGAGWVRLNFILGPWSSPEDATPHGSLGLGWTDTYRTIVDGLVGQGLQVYALIGAESVQSDQTVGSDAWITDYTYNFVAIVDRFKGDVRVYESYNEPNNWDANSEPVLSPYEYASLLQDVYLETKHHNGHDADPDWQVTLVSGPLFSFDDNPSDTYLTDTWWYGRNELAWDWTHDNTGSYPLDGVGYHVYVAQGSTDAREVQDGIEANLSAIQGVMDEEDPSSARQVWISEMGWTSDYVGTSGQADDLEAGLGYVRDDPRVALTSWFCLLDWPGAGYGLLTDATGDPASEKPAWARFVAVAGG